MDESGQNAPPDGGFSASFRRMGAALLSTVQNRIALLGVELQEEREWFVATVIWASALVFVSVCTVTLFTLAIVFLSPPEARPWVLVGLCLVHLAATIGLLLGLRKRIREKPPVFGNTLSELKKDITLLRPPE